MTLWIEFESQSFPASYALGSGLLKTSWDELLWAAITVGRPSIYHVFRHGSASFHEAVFRLSLVRMAIEQDRLGRLRRTDAFNALDPTEKGMVSYFLGMTLCKLFATHLLQAPLLLHLDVFGNQYGASTLGRSRPDLFGRDTAGRWHAFESKGRSYTLSANDKTNAKGQAQQLISVGAQSCSLHIGSFAFFRRNALEFYWRDPEPDGVESLRLPEPDAEWRFYFEPALRLADSPDSAALSAQREMTDVRVKIHPEILVLLREGQWLRARKRADALRPSFEAEGYNPDGIRVMAGGSWKRPFEPRVRG